MRTQLDEARLPVHRGPDVSELERTFVLASAHKPEEAGRVAAEAPAAIDLVVTSPTALAREAAAIAVRGRWVATVDEPLLTPRRRGESGGDVLARVAQALRSVHALDAHSPLIVCDGLDLLGAGVFVLDDDGVMRCADALERLLPR